MSSRTLERVVWLLGTCEVHLQAPPSAETRQSAYSLAQRCWRILPALGPRIREWTAEELPSSFQYRLEAIAEVCAFRDAWCVEFARRMNAREVPYALIKGVACGLLAYGGMQNRASFDIDVAVPRYFARAAQCLAEECGFEPAQWDEATRKFQRPNFLLRSLTEAHHFELGYLVRRQFLCASSDPKYTRLAAQCTPDQLALHLTEQLDVACYLGIDIHHGLALDIPADEFVAAATNILVTGTPVKVVCAAGALFHAVLKIYAEGLAWGEGLHHYADCIRLLTRADENSAFEFRALLNKYNLLGAAHHVLRRIPSNFFVPLPPAFEEIFQEGASAAAAIPDMWDNLLDAQAHD